MIVLLIGLMFAMIDQRRISTLKFQTPIHSPTSIDSTRIEALLGAVLTSIDHLKVDISSVKSKVDAHAKAWTC